MKKTLSFSSFTEAERMKGEDPCWDGYKMVGKKKKNGKEVPNCVPEEVEIDEAAPRNIDVVKAANRGDKALDKTYGYGTTKGGISPVAQTRAKQGFGAVANYNSARAALVAKSRGANVRGQSDAVHRGWGQTVGAMPAPDANKQAARKKLRDTPFFKLSKGEQDKDVVLARAVNAKEEVEPAPFKKHKSPEHIAAKHKVPVEQIKKELAMGIEVEKEHTKDPDTARDIALQHLYEKPNYYTVLKRVEKAPVTELASPIDVLTGNVPPAGPSAAAKKKRDVILQKKIDKNVTDNAKMGIYSEETLGKIQRTPGGPKKFMVKVRDPKTGNVKTVRFGDPNMEIKRDDPKRRKSFRARHGCGTPRASDRTKAAYWSCRQWRAGAKVES